ncbi:MAG: RepB family DNA primase, partial [Candidatus Sulfotelmatobacter sp.]
SSAVYISLQHPSTIRGEFGNSIISGRRNMDRTLIAVRNMLAALDAPAYDIGILSDRGMLPGLSNLPAHLVVSRLPLLKAHNRRGAHIYIRPSGAHRFTVLDDLNQTSIDRLTADDFEPCAVVETSAGNFQAWLKHDDVYPTDLSTFIAQTLAGRYQGDPSAADWRRFGRLPGFTNCKPKYRKNNGLYPYVLLRSFTGNQYRMASFLRIELIRQFQLQEHERQALIAQHRATAFSLKGGLRYSHLSMEKFRTAPKFHDRPAAADIAFCVVAYSLGMPDDAMARTLDSEYLSRDPNPARKAAYIQRTMAKARLWANR